MKKLSDKQRHVFGIVLAVILAVSLIFGFLSPFFM